MSYNLLQFPTGNLEGRTDTLANICDYYRPHILLIQELKNAQGLSDVTAMMNQLGYGSFDYGTFVPQQSNGGGGSNSLQQGIVYDSNVFELKSENVVVTTYRDVNEFVLYVDDPELENGLDTTYLYVYVTHLKSSQGADNQTLRLEMVNDWLAYMEENIPAGSHVILAGDFNLYTNQEPAYIALTNEDNLFPLTDVFASYGDWSGSGFAHKEILTQSTRLNQIYNDGAGGGMDDRFDFILLSSSLFGDDEMIQYSTGSYKSLGNTGNCYNMSITDCADGNEVPFDVLQSMYYMSDHLPQVCSLTYSNALNTHQAVLQQSDARIMYFSHDQNALELWTGTLSGLCDISIFNASGHLISKSQQTLQASSGTVIPFEAQGSGMYIIEISNGNQVFRDRFVAY
jgi:endonuclease/exonuclease/phosphatase family metal-dependent hydrolase